MRVNTTPETTLQTRENTAQKPATVPHVVIVGAGFGGLEAAKNLGKQPVKVTVIDRNNHHLFQPMLYQVATAGLSPEDISAPIRHVLRKQENTEVLMGEVTGIDVQAQRVHLRGDDQTIPYDYLIVATGASNNYFGHEDWAHIAPGLKSLNDSLDIRRKVLLAFEAAERETDPEKRKTLLTFVLVGAGPTGVELAGALAELVRNAFARDFRHIRPATARILLVGGPPHVLPHFPASISTRVQRHLAKMGVELRTGVHVTEIDENGVMIGKERVETKSVIWTAGVKASPAGHWLDAPVDHDGRVKVQRDLTVPGHANVFVIGDTALMSQKGKQLPGVAPVAIQEGRYAASVIADKVAGKDHPQPFRYVDKGTMATVGRGFGVVNSGPLRFTGTLAWFVWLFVHLLFLIGLPNRVIVFLQYIWTYLTYQKEERIILPEGVLPPVQ
ncbi:MAG TPA: NAD(P)/FAD-dependent oxidoreductase [Ktedonobacteraceae bacterium]